MADNTAYDKAAGSTDANARAALAALAQAGSAGKAAFDQGQTQVQAAQQAAVSQALGKAQLIGGAEAFSPSFTDTVAQPYTAASAALGQSKGQFNAGIAASNAMNRNYMGQVKAALPASRNITFSEIMDARMKDASSKQDELSNAEAKIQYQGAAENDFYRIKRENTDKYWEAKNAYGKATKDTKTKVAALSAPLASLNRDIAFFQNKLVELNPNGKKQSADDARRLKQSQEALSKLTGRRSQIQSQIDAISASSAAPTKQLEQKLAAARATSLAQPDKVGLARQRAIEAGVDPDRAQGLFGEAAYAAEATKATTAFNQKNPDVKKFADTFGMPVGPEAKKEFNDYKANLSVIDGYVTNDAAPEEVEATIRGIYAKQPAIADDLIKKYYVKYDRKAKNKKAAE